ncbi:hypothetical protein SAY87_015747 [Trapa incisa]|uniref:Uncharacterized protein n=1 Tax=Trapa incisa TaxID=236973 RepID=A0AAN7QWV2_9MYRT|nr:hypothetical protein SAY87_015747 [Trapa incisa]
MEMNKDGGKLNTHKGKRFTAYWMAFLKEIIPSKGYTHSPSHSSSNQNEIGVHIIDGNRSKDDHFNSLQSSHYNIYTSLLPGSKLVFVVLEASLTALLQEI